MVVRNKNAARVATAATAAATEQLNGTLRKSPISTSGSRAATGR
jgi:hypothetical protein